KEVASTMRKELSLLLGSKNQQGILWYDTLSRGKLSEYSKGMPAFTLVNLQKLLNSNEYVDNRFNEFVSNVFNKDIYIINYSTQDLYITGKDDDILYKNRDSIVLIWYRENHYDLLGIIENNKLRTLFDTNHPFITLLKDRKRNL
ncbi:MAG TPA: hypothetical protein VKR58_12850, partial [Aquella sp.]|nr:hypothetical protein [Aquella sp.]